MVFKSLAFCSAMFWRLVSPGQSPTIQQIVKRSKQKDGIAITLQNSNIINNINHDSKQQKKKTKQHRQKQKTIKKDNTINQNNKNKNKKKSLLQTKYKQKHNNETTVTKS